MHSKKIFIRGMHCPSCEKLLNGEIRNVAGVADVKVNWKNGTAEIYFEKTEPSTEAIRKIVEKFGYSLSEGRSGDSKKDPAIRQDWPASNASRSYADWVTAGLVVVVILFIYKLFLNSSWLGAINIQKNSLSFGVAFLVGLVASVSSCLAVVGAVVVAFSEKYQSAEKGFFAGAIRPNIFFHVGRLATFFVLGALLGAVGGELNISGSFVSFYTILIAVVMGWLGLNILGLVPSLSAIGIRMPAKFSARWENLKQSEHQAAPFVLGGLTFFLPCGFTQSMQLFALASGSFFIGGFSLVLFALGTVPTLLALGITASWMKNRNFAVFQKVAGILVILFAVFSLNSGLALRGVKTNVISSTSIKEQSVPKATLNPSLNPSPSGSSAEQVVTMKVTASGFEPDVFRIKPGVPVKWVIDGVNVSGCTNTIIMPAYNISKNIKYGENIVEFTPQKKGNLDFSCGMGMVRGKFIIQ